MSAGVVRSPRLATALVLVAAGCAGYAAPAAALIALNAGSGATFTNFAPAHTATATGSLTATDTSASWTLQVQDTGTGAGHMVAGATGCSGSDPQLSDALTVNVTSPLGGFISNGTVTLSATNQTVAHATIQLLVANVFTTNYSQLIPATQVMLTG